MVPYVPKGNQNVRTRVRPTWNLPLWNKGALAKGKYLRRLDNFFEFLELDGTTEQKAKEFVTLADRNGTTWVSAKLMRYLSYQKDKAERGEITGATIKNYKRSENMK